MTRGKKLMYVVFVLVAIGLLGCACSVALNSQPVTPKGQPAAKQQIKDVNIVGDPKAPVKLIAYFPLNAEHRFIFEYLLTLPKKYNGKVYVEAYDMQSEKGRAKWSSSGLSCAGVFVNGKTTWDVLRGGKKDTVSFVKRMGPFWSAADLEAVIKSQLKNPKAIPVVPKAVKPAKTASKGK